MNSLSNAIRAHGRILAVAGGTVVLLVGFLAGLPQAGPPPVYASCQITHGTCAGGDATRTGVIEVAHKTTGVDWVEPNTGETWQIDVEWDPSNGVCTPHLEQANATVDWNGSGWSVSNFVATANILNVTVCDISGSCGSTAGPRAYALLVNLNDPIPVTLQNLHSVTFTTTSVDGGFTIPLNTCVTSSTAVTPTSQTFTATDTGNFECAYACGSVSGASISLTYH
jgi:hypothetical protein